MVAKGVGVGVVVKGTTVGVGVGVAVVPPNILEKNDPMIGVMKILQVPGNGDCLFTALYCGMQALTGRLISPFTQEACDGGRSLRHHVAWQIPSALASTQPLDCQLQTDAELRQDVGLTAQLPREAALARYCQAMSTHLYGDDYARCAFSRLFRINVTVYALSSAGHLVRQAEQGCFPHTIELLNTNSHDRVAAHFDLLLRL